MRLSACFNTPLDVIRPTAFRLDDKSLMRAALDYGPLGETTVHEHWDAFLAAPQRRAGRLVLFTTRGATRLDDFVFEPDDTLLFGRESAGAPASVHSAAQARVVIPIAAATRSLNLSVSAGIALWEGLRQTGALNASVEG